MTDKEKDKDDFSEAIANSELDSLGIEKKKKKTTSNPYEYRPSYSPKERDSSSNIHPIHREPAIKRKPPPRRKEEYPEVRSVADLPDIPDFLKREVKKKYVISPLDKPVKIGYREVSNKVVFEEDEFNRIVRKAALGIADNLDAEGINYQPEAALKILKVIQEVLLENSLYLKDNKVSIISKE